MTTENRYETSAEAREQAFMAFGRLDGDYAPLRCDGCALVPRALALAEQADA